MAKGFILEHFNSPFNGNNCVAILTLNSQNRKIGIGVPQVWIPTTSIQLTLLTPDGMSRYAEIAYTANNQTVLGVVTSILAKLRSVFGEHIKPISISYCGSIRNLSMRFKVEQLDGERMAIPPYCPMI